MKITIDINTGNDAFRENYQAELAECLNNTVRRIVRNGQLHGSLFDSNGNTVGKFKTTGK